MKLKLAEWASVSEIIAAVAVVVSLLLLVRSVDENTEVITASEANNIWESWRQIAVLPVLNNPQLAEVHSKVLESQPLSSMEQRQYDVYLAAQIDLFAQLFERRNSGLVSEEYWGYWEHGFWADWEVRNFARIYEGNRDYYSADFVEYVDSEVADRGLAGL
jgi:hypothetical protein